jgi:hypothetical protein
MAIPPARWWTKSNSPSVAETLGLRAVPDRWAWIGLHVGSVPFLLARTPLQGAGYLLCKK